MKGLFFPFKESRPLLFQVWFFGSLSDKDSYKITVPCLSLHQQFEIFIRNALLLFSDFLHHDRYVEYIKTDRAFFFQENSFFSKFGQKLSKMIPNKGFLDFLENFIFSFPGNNLKWKPVLLLIFYHQSHIWKSSGSRVIGQNALGQSNIRIL